MNKYVNKQFNMITVFCDMILHSTMERHEGVSKQVTNGSKTAAMYIRGCLYI
jgi:hypothetical protein